MSTIPTRSLRTGIELSTLGFGGAPLGELFDPVSESQAQETLGAAWDAGIRYYDTSPHYGAGLAEQRFGRLLSKKPRDEFVLSTKVGRLLQPTSRPENAQPFVWFVGIAGEFVSGGAWGRSERYPKASLRGSRHASGGA